MSFVEVGTCSYRSTLHAKSVDCEDWQPSLEHWIEERMNNCMKIAQGKSGPDQAGWLEDADCFRRVLQLIRATSKAAVATQV
jgi:hypothetical protein